LTSASTRNS